MSDLTIIQPTEEEQKGLEETFEINRDTYDHFNEEKLTFKAEPGINEELVRFISKDKTLYS